MTTESVAPDVMEAEVDAWHVEAQRRYIQRDVRTEMVGGFAQACTASSGLLQEGSRASWSS